MKRVLGLDLGTNSIGWAVVNQAENNNEESSIVKIGVRVTPLSADEKDNFEKGKAITTTADRTLKRGMRRNLQRYKLRREHLLHVLKRENWIDDETLLGEEGNATTFETYRLRAKAAQEQITLPELARVLLMINKKRGYKSNRRARNQEEGTLIDGMEIARRLYDDNLTPGQLSYQLIQQGKKHLPDFYASDLRHELQCIWQEQQKHYSDILTDELFEQLHGKNQRGTEATFATMGWKSAELKDRKTRTATLLRWRAEALNTRLEPEQIVSIIANINSAIGNSSGYLGAISDRSKELYFEKQTVGQHLMSLLDDNPNTRLKNRVFYRQDYLNEFETIWECQRQFYPSQLTDELKHELRDVVIFYQRRLKSMKGLVSFCEFESREITVNVNGQERKVMTGCRVCPKSSPLFQQFKIWSTVNNLMIEDRTRRGRKADNQPALTLEQKQLVVDELNGREKMTDSEILKLLGYNDNDYKLNFKQLQGNTTLVAILEACKKVVEWSGHDVEKFDKLDSRSKFMMVDQVLKGALGADTSFLTFDCVDADTMQAEKLFKLWHLLYSYEGDDSATGNDRLIAHISALTGLSPEYAAAFTTVNLVDDYGSLSTKAILKIMPFLKQGYIYSEACEMAGYRHSKASLTKEENESRELVDTLPLLQKGALRNPVVEKILNQMIHVVNGCNSEYGPFNEIHVEMARTLKQTQEQREKATTRLRARTDETEKIKKILQESPFNIPRPTRKDVIRYRLYQELAPNGYKTLYSQTYIPKDRLFSRDFDIEHIIPQALLFDDSLNNKTIESRAVNIEKSKMTAMDYVRSKEGEAGAKEYEKRIAFLYDKNNRNGTNRKHAYLLMTEKDIPSDFLNRDLSDSQYIARKAKELLQQMCRVVVPTTGAITARLREDWQLVDVMKELNWDKYSSLGLTTIEQNKEGHQVRIINGWTKRNDHRHHAMDALTIAFTRLQHIQLLNNLNAASGDEPSDNALALIKNEITEKGKFLPPMPLDELRREALRQLDAVLVSIKAKNKVVTRGVNKMKGGPVQATLTPRGQLHNETIYGSKRFYQTKEETVNATFDAAKIATVARKDYREALMRRLNENGGDPKKAFTGKNSLKKNPLFTTDSHATQVPEKVKTVQLCQQFTIRKPISKDIKIEKVIDKGVQRILWQRLSEFGNDYAKAFSNLDENPIWINKEQGIAIKRVTITGVREAVALHEKRDNQGRVILDENAQHIPTDYVSTSNNHHVAIFEDADGNLQEHIVSMMEATAAANCGLPIVDKNYRHDQGWKFLFTMKQNEYFVFPGDGFNPEEVDLTDPSLASEISKHLFRVQKLSTKYYVFRHHLETTVSDDNALRDVTWKRIQNTNGLKGIFKVRVNHLGQIQQVGEY